VRRRQLGGDSLEEAARQQQVGGGSSATTVLVRGGGRPWRRRLDAMGRLKTGGRIDRERLGSGGNCSGKSETEAWQQG
jgi:hypothetical protein